ncbi:MAG: hypothetical protein M1827_004168 [Pycnora praestabilis]|nr:MAG: hypothetical protein M1827_004168 [Pycnora praestabilis]
MAQRVPIAIGLTAAGAAGYYLYAAGGSPKVAQKEAEHDAARFGGSNQKSAEKKAELWAEKAGKELDHAGKTLDHAADEARARLNQADAKLDNLRQDASKKISEVGKDTKEELHQTIDNFDKTAIRKTVEAKNGISSWFGFGGSK